MRLSENLQPHEGASLILFLAFLFPVAIYCLILGVINRRDRPLLVSGTWDFVGVLFAASGFLLFVGPSVLAALHESWRYFLLFGRGGSLGLGDASYYFWVSLWGLYYCLVVGGSAFMLLRRRPTTAIYNVELANLQIALTHVLERLGLSWTRAGNQFFITPSEAPRDGAVLAQEQLPVLSRVRVLQQHVSTSSQEMEKVIEAAPGIRPLAPPHFLALLELDTFRPMCHATLRWRMVDPPLRQEIEGELDKALSGTLTRSNGSGGWFLCLGGLMLLAVFLCMVLLILVNMPQGR
jgi:hypothetical protein